MVCAFPLEAFIDRNTGEPVFGYHPGRDLQPVYWPCGRCGECRKQKSAELALRVRHELRAAGPFAASQFLTLTIDDAHLPRCDADWRRMGVLFVKRLRKYWSGRGVAIRTFGCRERGEFGDRPHFHVGLMGARFEVSREWAGVGRSGKATYAAPELAKLWPFGHVSCAELTDQSVGYIARYCMKKLVVGRNESGAFVQYGRRRVAVSPYVLPDGSVAMLAVAESFARSQGLGRAWVDAYGEQAVREGHVTLIGGREAPLPEYYLRRVAKSHPEVADLTRQARREASRVNWREAEPDRRAVRVAVSEARTRFYSEGKR